MLESTGLKEKSCAQRILLSVNRRQILHVEKINAYRIQIWLKEIFQRTGETRVFALASLLDPKSNWRDDFGSVHQSKWYGFTKHKVVPSKTLATRVRDLLPQLEFDLHHPAWSLILRPSVSQRTLERQVAKMSHEWRSNLKKIKATPFEFRRVCLPLVDEFNLMNCSYLDAYLLFEIARRYATGKDQKKAENLMYVLMALPLLYVDDPIWMLLNDSQHHNFLDLLDETSRTANRNLQFPNAERAIAIRIQKMLLQKSTKKQAGLKTSASLRRRYLAKFLSRDIDSVYVTATSAFFSQSSIGRVLRLLMNDVEHYSEVAWKNAWKKLRTDSAYVEFTKCFEVLSSEKLD